MSILIHTCTGCGHADLQHIVRTSTSAVDCGHGGCRCKTLQRMGPSELRPTFDSLGRLIERIVPPGTRVEGGLPPLMACGCDECKQAYADLEAVSRAS